MHKKCFCFNLGTRIGSGLQRIYVISNFNSLKCNCMANYTLKCNCSISYLEYLHFTAFICNGNTCICRIRDFANSDADTVEFFCDEIKQI